jgi:RNA polymerase sigma factor (sigma-70 family)
MVEPDLERLFLENLPLIDRMVASVCRRNRLTKEECEDFRSVVHLKLIADGYEVLRKYSGKCASIRGYLNAVVNHAYQDHRNHLWGKWRPSTEARRLGALATWLDTMLHRDGLTLEEACARAAPEDREELQRLATLLAPRAKRRMEDVRELEQLPSGQQSPEEELIDREREAVLERLHEALAEVKSKLGSEDQLLLHLRLERPLSLVRIAQAFGWETRRMYRHWARLIEKLRAQLEGRGFTSEQVAWILEPEADGGGPEETGPGPSKGSG